MCMAKALLGVPDIRLRKFTPISTGMTVQANRKSGGQWVSKLHWCVGAEKENKNTSSQLDSLAPFSLRNDLS